LRDMQANVIGEFFDRELMKEIRSKFAYTDNCPYSGKRAYLDNCSGSLRLCEMVENVKKEIMLPDQFGRLTKGSEHMMQVKAKAENDVLLFLGVSSGKIMPALSATDAIFRVIRNAISHFPGSNVVTTALEHASVFSSMKMYADINQKEWRVAPIDKETGSVKTESILELIDKNTSVLAFIHGSNMTGSYLDVSTIVKETRRINKNTCIIIDGVQYVPHAQLYLDEFMPDVYVFTPYKAYGKKGIAFAWLSERFSLIPHDKLIGKKVNDWELGSMDHGEYAAFSSVIDYICWLGSHFTLVDERRTKIVAGMNAIAAHNTALLNKLVNVLRPMHNIVMYGITDKLENRSCVIPFNIKGLNSSQCVNKYLFEGIVVQNRISDAYSKHFMEGLGVQEGELIRLSAAHYNTPEEIDFFIEVTNKFAT